ncbi:MurR/RpiR family transcriptional regulator [Bacillaceae bacterium SIJ1]|uniref:MurR/RpiR family transcriptional regulator n=1 Tax=Litoribacterium kuwaitense TaxID=1398745 RepID=UPI0013EABB84|nr:MurR/RpiR family transcriptional regulator [Litoribacterium kuwaitense]NGP44229.1 MurR/RpiR family transcriptional regulator [Litoribacterium kuwaitense]
MLKGGLTMLESMLDKLPRSEKKIATYIMEYPEKAVQCTASELGELSETSSAAVIRLCKSLGLKGFQELKLRVAGDLQKEPSYGFRDIHPDETTADVMSKITSNAIASITETAELLQVQAINDAVTTIRNASAVHIFGIGASSIVAKDFQQKLLRIQKHATAYESRHMASIQAAGAEKGDVVMGISFSGNTKEVKEFLELGRAAGAVAISLGSYGQSLVSSVADIELSTSPTREATFRSGATSSRIAQLLIIDVLFMCLCTSDYERSIQAIDFSRQVIDRLNQ